MAPHRTGNCFTCQTRNEAEWCALQKDDVGLLNEIKICNHYQPGQYIFYQGNPCMGIYCISSGTIALRKTDTEGNSMIVRLVHHGQTLGYRSYFSGEAYTASAEVLVAAEVCFVDRAGVAKLLNHNPNLGLRFLQRLALDLRSSEDQRLQASALPVRARLAHLVLSLKDRFATVDESGCITIELPLSRQDMASIVGTRPETIARTIRALEDDDVVHFKGRQVVISDLDALLDELEPVV
jgi:CRP/FNR family transcriptional regulator